MEFFYQALLALVSGAFAGGGAYAALRVELKYLRRDVDHAHRRIDVIDDHLREAHP